MIRLYHLHESESESRIWAISAIGAVSASRLRKFRVNDTIETLFFNLMIDFWNVTPNFEGYYRSCAPHACTYQITQRMDRAHVVATILGVFGGLVTVLRLLVPIAVLFVHKLFVRHSSHQSDIESRETDPPRIGRVLSFIHSARQWLIAYAFAIL
jgi:hypothetical protein